ncbi:hypothetical protein [Chondromyces apiculatus]|uniref:Uncharacterized protein n=1 Tax=Chondromyces apiculatus DSM 436 TaxID=1192034 RepID=A0A017T5Z6_9BACT|nr:hypothetical protein [Chondromyces apiculatus]EYF04006.1 Hypothetical protein CAP_4880 [Chondromyces apiculatus DSM 436]
MMLAWSFAARTPDDVGRLLRALGRHRYVLEVDHRIHWAIDVALADLPTFAPHAEAFVALRRRAPDLDPASRDPRLWREAKTEDVVAALTAFWTPGDAARAHRQRLLAALASAGIAPATHAPFASRPEEPPHPELVLLDWELHAVDDLDTERHAGALTAMEEAEEEIEHPSSPIYQEGPVLAAPELCDGAPEGVLPEDFLVWSDGPYSYSDYVFRGAARAAKLPEAPLGYHDF